MIAGGVGAAVDQTAAGKAFASFKRVVEEDKTWAAATKEGRC
jgi:hypothetical protein